LSDLEGGNGGLLEARKKGGISEIFVLRYFWRKTSKNSNTKENSPSANCRANRMQKEERGALHRHLSPSLKFRGRCKMDSFGKKRGDKEGFLKQIPGRSLPE